MTTPDCRTLTVETEDRTLAVDGLTEGTDGQGWQDDYILSAQYFGMYYMPALYFPVLYCTGAPSERTLVIEAEDRTWVIGGSTYSSDDPLAVYGLVIYGEVRYGVNETPAERTLVIEAENRTLAIEACQDGG